MDEGEVMVEFGRRKRRRIIAAGVVLGAVVMVPILAQWLGDDNYAFGFGIFVLVCFGLFVWKDWRCPACEELLGRTFHYTYCPHCGTRLSL